MASAAAAGRCNNMHMHVMMLGWTKGVASRTSSIDIHISIDMATAKQLILASELTSYQI